MDPKTSAILAALVSAGAFAAVATLIGIDSVRLAAPAFAALPLAVYLKGRERASPFRIGPMLNEAPSVVSMMSTVLAAGGSLDAAIRYVAENGPARSSAVFRENIAAETFDAGHRAAFQPDSGRNGRVAGRHRAMQGAVAAGRRQSGDIVLRCRARQHRPQEAAEE